MKPDELVLGVDGGGSRTVAWLAPLRGATGDRPLGCGESAAANPRGIGFERALSNLGRAVDAAWRDAALSPGRLAAACLALAGADRKEERVSIERWANQRGLAVRLSVVNDAEPLLAAAASDGVGVALISGTGSFAWGRNGQGQTARVGGWGYLMGDEGSGFAIAAAALRAAVRFADGRGPATLLLERLLQQLQVSTAADLIPAIYQDQNDRARVASLAPLVIAAAGDGDAPARQIVSAAAADLALMTAALCERLALPRAALPLAVSGGVLCGSETVRRQLLAALAGQGVEPNPLTIVPQPVRGAVALARRLVAS